MRTLPGIPTVFNGVRYRSRLEARYASFFDALGWSYEYEAIDLHGYIPDFVITRGLGPEPVVVEVKPFVPPFANEDVVQVCNRIERAGWEGHALVVGAAHLVESEPMPSVLSLLDDDGLARTAPTLTTAGTSTICIGRMRTSTTWHDAYLYHAPPLQPPTEPDDCTGYWCITPNAAEAALDRGDFFTARAAWATAGNATQWAPR